MIFRVCEAPARRSRCARARWRPRGFTPSRWPRTSEPPAPRWRAGRRTSAVASRALSRGPAARRIRFHARVAALRARCVRRPRAQTLLRTDDHRRLLLVDSAWIGMAADTEMLVRPASILVADVPTAHIAGQDQDLLSRSILTCLAPAHGCICSKYPERHGDLTLHVFVSHRRTFKLAAARAAHGVLCKHAHCRQRTDGTAEVQAINAAGGLRIAQDPKTADFTGREGRPEIDPTHSLPA